MPDAAETVALRNVAMRRLRSPGMSTSRHVPTARPQQLSGGWRVAVAVGWTAIFLALVGVLATSQRLGLNTWWLGPFGERTSPLLTALPFVAPAVMVVLVLNNARYLPWFGLIAAAVTAVVGAIDLDHVRRLAAVELALAAAGALLSLASFAGVLRPQPALGRRAGVGDTRLS